MNRKITPSQKLEQEIAELSTLRRETDNLLGDVQRQLELPSDDNYFSPPDWRKLTVG